MSNICIKNGTHQRINTFIRISSIVRKPCLHIQDLRYCMLLPSIGAAGKILECPIYGAILNKKFQFLTKFF